MNQDKLKIVFLHRANDPYTLERIKYFSFQKHEVYSVSFSLFNYKSKSQTEIEGVNVIRLRKHIIDKIPFFKRFSHYFELKKILKKIKPDIFHVVSALNLFYTNTRYSKIKIIQNQGSDVIITPHRYKFLIPFYWFYFKKVDGIIQDSKIAYESALKYGATDNPELNKIIGIGIDFNVFNKDVEKGVIRKLHNLGQRKIVLYTRGLTEIYNTDIVLKSLLIVREKIPSCIYIFTTTMDKLDSDKIKFIVKNKLENNLLFAGYQDRLKSLQYFYSDADVNISVPSSDSSPFSVYESMVCMTPNIVTDLSWLYDKFIPDKHLITCPVRDAEVLANKIIEVLNGEHNIDLSEAYNIVFDKIHFLKENAKLELFYKYLLSESHK